MGLASLSKNIIKTSSQPTIPRGYLRRASPLLRKRPAPLWSADVERYAFKRHDETFMRLCSRRMISGVWSEAIL